MRHGNVLYRMAAVFTLAAALTGCSAGSGEAPAIPLFELRDGAVTADTEGADIEVLNLEDPKQMSYSRTDADMIFKYKDGSWRDGMDETIPIDQERFQSMADLFLNLRAVEEVDEPDAFRTYGLNSPKYQVFLEDGEAGDVEVSIGAQNEDGDYYAAVDEDDVYVIKAEAVEALIFDYNSLVVRDSLNLDVNAADVKKATVTSGGKKTSYKSSDKEVMNRIANGITQLKPVHFTSYHASAQDLAYAELDEANRTVFTAEIAVGGENRTLTVYIGGYADVDEKWNYIQLGGSDMISMIDSTIIKELINAE